VARSEHQRHLGDRVESLDVRRVVTLGHARTRLGLHLDEALLTCVTVLPPGFS
jgi:hypothetical protein